jgi:hypothetical protein
VFNASRVQLSYPSRASLLSMQLTFEYQVVICTRRSISKRVLKKWFGLVVVEERRNAVRGQECHDEIERRRAAYPIGLTQGFREDLVNDARFVFSLCRSGCWVPLLYSTFSFPILDVIWQGRRVYSHLPARCLESWTLRSPKERIMLLVRVRL